MSDSANRDSLRLRKIRLSNRKWPLLYEATADGLGLYRIFVATWLLVFGVSTCRWVSRFPDGFMAPLPLTLSALWPGIPSSAVTTGIDIATHLLLVLLLFGYRTRLAGLGLTVLLLASMSLSYVFHKIDHPIALVLIIAMMRFSPWGRSFSLGAYRSRANGTQAGDLVGRPALAVLAFCLAFGFFTAGFPKLLGWVDFDLSTSGARAWLVHGYHESGRTAYLATAAMQLRSPILWEFADYLTVAFELAFLPAFFRPRVFRWMMALAVLFHAMNYLVLNISFSVNLIAYAAFAPWERTAELVRSFTPRLRSVWPATAAAALVMFSLLAVDTWNGSPFYLARGLFPDHSKHFGFIKLLVVPAVAFSWIAFTSSKAFKRWIRSP
jgi:hypothetical protein